MSEERTLPAESLVKVLQAVKMAFPDLGLLLENLQKPATLPSATGIANCWLSGLELLLQTIIPSTHFSAMLGSKVVLRNAIAKQELAGTNQ